MLSFFLGLLAAIVLVVLLIGFILGWHVFTYIWFLISTSIYRVVTGKNPLG
jgi:uncharacterized membrane protein